MKAGGVFQFSFDWLNLENGPIRSRDSFWARSMAKIFPSFNQGRYNTKGRDDVPDRVCEKVQFDVEDTT
jgi:hypothetical protein